MNFDAAFERLIGHEGGYVNDPQDPGGETKFGISKRSYPREDISNMTLERAKEIYRKDFWGAAGCDAVPTTAKFDLFDMAVSSGVKPAICTLQNAVGAVPDGIIGGRTLQALNEANPIRLAAHFNAHRLLFMTNLKNWEAHGKGWARRVAKNILEA